MTGTLKIKFLDVYGAALDDTVDVMLSHSTLSFNKTVKAHSASRQLTIQGLPAPPSGIYRVFIYPMRHHAVGQFVRIQEDKATLLTPSFPLDAGKVVGANFPEFKDLPEDLKAILEASGDVEGDEGKTGDALYQGLDDLQRAGLLNLYTKMANVQLSNGRNVFTYVRELKRVRGARIYVLVDRPLRDDVINSTATKIFHSEPGGMHHAKPPFRLVDSYKTSEHYGNLQLTFFVEDATVQYMVDADIDDAQGIEHAFQVISHLATGEDSNPYDIHEILVGYQHLDPGYTLVA
jgi:hypothetical protein